MRYLILTLTFLLCITDLAAQKPVKVACVGNSITYGAGIINREKNCYPAQLQAYLGDNWEVRNFGVSGRTTLSKGDHPYIETDAYQQSLSYQPDIVLIKLGTNDTKPQNWKYKEDFLKDYQTLIDSYRALGSHPRVVLLTPVRCFLPEGSSINSQLIEKEVRPMLEELAWRNDLEIINMFNIFGDDWKSYLMPDKLHPSSIGAGVMAKKIYNFLTLNSSLQAKSIESVVPRDAQKFNFHGYQGYEFYDKGVLCKVVKPYIEAEGRPWVIRARFWNHEPQTDIDLLEQGFYITYCDVTDMYGSDKAVRRWDRFYKKMVKAGFNKKVVLEGMSRGGLIVYNWAAKNADKVACIYADAPVMDIKSWPMGKGGSTGSVNDTRKLLAAYGFKNEGEALAWKRNPLDYASVIAKAKIPVIHVVGDADAVVPVDENTAVFEQQMNKLNAPITVIHKPAVGHHPHSLNNPEMIVRFILTATGRNKNDCVHPVPGNEFRTTAGWVEGADWYGVAEEITETLQGKKLKLLLLGNSITQAWGGTRKAITNFKGKQAMDDAIGEGVWESAGISGDRTQHLLWRLQHGNYNVCRPENVVIAIGINNLGGTDTPEDTAEGIIAVANEARRQFPNSHIILLGPYPAGKEKQAALRIKCDRVHDILSTYPFHQLEYVNPTGWYVDDNETIREGLYGNDYIHMTSEGYKITAEKIATLIRK
ncbi:GDSL-like Lipase/Acylhydrolase family [Proteiniphilum saccharofermentans]|uniref:GDSL-like Lipase/Acylhydrolase family n=1 Tax=Proteiniphilum saccharofermentans TaxID=1642647 RepID=A0A1R3T4C3_9BACT|nr:GDSL-type esterase/lipase family protein [Proteiniphilum saccharofermentans]SCD19377.1 GDSL-like Lipase/Acylhydrolase family [Proteiniphilum saccharofermentans]